MGARSWAMIAAAAAVMLLLHVSGCFVDNVGPGDPWYQYTGVPWPQSRDNLVIFSDPDNRLEDPPYRSSPRDDDGSSGSSDSDEDAGDSLDSGDADAVGDDDDGASTAGVR